MLFLEISVYVSKIFKWKYFWVVPSSNNSRYQILDSKGPYFRTAVIFLRFTVPIIGVTHPPHKIGTPTACELYLRYNIILLYYTQ